MKRVFSVLRDLWIKSNPLPMTIASYTLHPTHCVLHFASYTLHLTHYIIHIASYVLPLTHCIDISIFWLKVLKTDYKSLKITQSLKCPRWPLLMTLKDEWLQPCNLRNLQPCNLADYFRTDQLTLVVKKIIGSAEQDKSQVLRNSSQNYSLRFYFPFVVHSSFITG